MSAVEEVIDNAVEIAEETAEAVGAVYDWRCGLTRGQHVAQLAIVGVVAAGIGGTVAYFATKKHLETKYDKLVEREIAEAKAFYSQVNKEEYPTPQSAVEKLMAPPAVVEAADALLKYQGSGGAGKYEETVEETVEETITVFPVNDDIPDWDEEAEIAARDPDKPYVISQREYLQNDPDFEQTVITYYAGDGTLADEEDQEIPYPDPIIGAGHLNMFGHGSNDERIVYIRNEALSTDFEVTLSDGKYSHEVLGFQHSDGGSRGRRQSSELRRFREPLEE